MTRYGILVCLLFIEVLLQNIQNTQAACELEPGSDQNFRVQIKELTQTDIDNDNQTLPTLPIQGELGVDIESFTLATGKNEFANAFEVIFNDLKGVTVVKQLKPIDRDGTLANPLDDVNSVEYTLMCKPVSGPTISYPLRIRIVDINDNAPQFINLPYTVSWTELTQIGTAVFRSVTAEDLDSGVNKDIEYTVNQGDGGVLDGSHKFKIDAPRQGVISIKAQLDYEELVAAGQTYYLLTVTATDQGSPAQSSSAVVNITITDADDLPPHFIYKGCTQLNGICISPTYTAKVISKEVGGAVIVSPESILARDQDTLNSQIQYSIVDGTIPNYQNFFNINSSTGDITQIQAVDRNIIQDFELTILAQEVTAQRRYETAVVKFTVTPVLMTPHPTDGGTRQSDTTVYMVPAAMIIFVVSKWM